MAKPDLWSVRATAAAALAAGAERTSLTTVKWNVAGRCERPVHVLRAARPPRGKDGNVIIGPGRPHGMWVEIETPCRTCPACLRQRAARWRYRATEEIKASSRTWFCTWTLSPDARYRTLTSARAASSAKAVPFEERDPAEQFRLWCRSIGREFTLGLKRLRKNTGSPLRYVIIAEGHKDGTPHFHGLIHEVSPIHPITHKALVQSIWRLGFARYKLADEGSGGYVTKYLTKSALARVRASGRYGDGLSRNPPHRGGCENSTSREAGARQSASARRDLKHRESDEVPF